MFSHMNMADSCLHGGKKGNLGTEALSPHPPKKGEAAGSQRGRVLSCPALTRPTVSVQLGPGGLGGGGRWVLAPLDSGRRLCWEGLVL